MRTYTRLRIYPCTHTPRPNTVLRPWTVSNTKTLEYSAVYSTVVQTVQYRTVQCTVAQYSTVQYRRHSTEQSDQHGSRTLHMRSATRQLLYCRLRPRNISFIKANLEPPCKRSLIIEHQAPNNNDKAGTITQRFQECQFVYPSFFALQEKPRLSRPAT